MLAPGVHSGSGGPHRLGAVNGVDESLRFGEVFERWYGVLI